MRESYCKPVRVVEVAIFGHAVIEAECLFTLYHAEEFPKSNSSQASRNKIAGNYEAEAQNKTRSKIKTQTCGKVSKAGHSGRLKDKPYPLPES